MAHLCGTSAVITEKSATWSSSSGPLPQAVIPAWPTAETRSPH